MKVATFNGCKVYNLSSGKTMPQWLSDAKKRALLKDDEYRQRLELIQDFEMSVASQVVKMTKDGEHIIVTGTYPPVVRCYTVSDLALKFQRGLTCEVVAFETLSDDFGKLVFLQADRTLNFHAPYGTHYSVRVPRFGRDLAYHQDSCDLLVGGAGNEVFRLNLQAGQFQEPLTLGFSGCNKLHINPVHQLIGCGGETAACEFWDPRSHRVASTLTVDPSSAVQVTALKFDTDGLTLGVGTSNGNCILYDIRSKVPLYTKEHQYGLPVLDVTFHNSSRHVISTDKKIVKIWERDEPNMGKIMTNIETPADINHIHVVEDKRGSSGLLMLAGEQTRVMTYFVPQLGPAPRWCSFLEGITEELEETAGQVYEDYKFLTKHEVEELGASSLIGTPMLRGYMHGFFIDMKLYSRLRAVSKPFEYEEYRLKRIKDKIEEKRQSRIVAQKRAPKVNKALAEKLSSSTGSAKNVIVDDRFASLFKREEFQQDETSLDYKLRNPVSRGHGRRSGEGSDSEDDLQEMYTAVGERGGGNDDDDDGSGLSDYGEEVDDDDDEDIGDHELPRDLRKKRHLSRGNDDDDGDDDEEGQIAKSSRRTVELMERIRAKAHAGAGYRSNATAQRAGARMLGGVSARVGSASSKSSQPKMFELTEGVNPQAALFRHSEEARAKRAERRESAEVPLSERVKVLEKDASRGGKSSGNKIRTVKSATEGVMREISFMPKEDSKGSRKSAKKTDSAEGVAGGFMYKERKDDLERVHFGSLGDASADFRGDERGGGRGGGRGRSGGRGRGGGRGGRGGGRSGRGRR